MSLINKYLMIQRYISPEEIEEIIDERILDTIVVEQWNIKK